MNVFPKLQLRYSHLYVLSCENNESGFSSSPKGYVMKTEVINYVLVPVLIAPNPS